jgi:hypothetical protein
MTLAPAGTNNFYGRVITEADPVPGGGATDTCWFLGSKYDPFTSAVSGGTWHVQSNANIWGDPTVDTVSPYDWLGFSEDVVAYYQTYAEGWPCSVSGPQQMKISCQSPTSFVPYILNTLTDGLYTGSVFVQRQNNYQSRTWP